MTPTSSELKELTTHFEVAIIPGFKKTNLEIGRGSTLTTEMIHSLDIFYALNSLGWMSRASFDAMAVSSHVVLYALGWTYDERLHVYTKPAKGKQS